MIERVITTLKALANVNDTGVPASVDRQLSRARLLDVGRDYSDAYRLLADCPQVQLTTRQALALEKLDGLLADLEASDPGSSAGADDLATEHSRVVAAAISALATIRPPDTMRELHATGNIDRSVGLS